MKSAVQQVRARMGMADDWDENVEERTEDFWSTERGWETNQDPGGAALGGDDASGTAAGPASPPARSAARMAASSAPRPAARRWLGDADEINEAWVAAYPGSLGKRERRRRHGVRARREPLTYIRPRPDRGAAGPPEGAAPQRVG